MGVDVLKKLRGDAERRLKRDASGAPVKPKPKFEPAHGIFVSSNWKSLLERKPSVAPKAAAAKDSLGLSGSGGVSPNVVAVDCEMVGVGADGKRSVLARVSIVDFEGSVLLDRYVLPQERVTDYRSHITGITAATLRGKNVLSEDVARRKTAELLDGKIVVGHSLQNDFQALMLSHPHVLIRDTALFRPLRLPGRENRMPSLAGLVEHWFREKIHEGHHDSIEDARMALRLYRLKSRLWEKQMRSAMRGQAEASGASAVVVAGADDEDEGEQVERPAAAGSATTPRPAEGRRRSSKKRKAEVGPAEDVAAVGKAKNPGKKKRAAAAREAELRGGSRGAGGGKRKKRKKKQS